MARRSPQPESTSQQVLECIQRNFPSCGQPIWNEYDNYRQVRKRGGSSTTTFKNPSMSKLVVRTLSNCISTGTRGQVGITTTRIWTRCDCTSWSITLARTSKCTSNTSTTLLARRLCEPAQRQPSIGTI